MKKIIKILCIMLCMIMGFNVSGCYKFAGLKTIKTVEQANEYFPKYAEYVQKLLDEKEIKYVLEKSIEEDDTRDDIVNYGWLFLFNDGYLHLYIRFKKNNSISQCGVHIGLLCSDVEKEQSKIKEHLLMFHDVIEFTNGNEQRFGNFQDYEELLNVAYDAYFEDYDSTWKQYYPNNYLFYEWIKMEIHINEKFGKMLYENLTGVKVSDYMIVVKFSSHDVLSDKNIINN